MSPKERTDWLLQDHLTGIICFGEFTMIQARAFNLRSLQTDIGHVPEFIQIQVVKFRWLYHKTFCGSSVVVSWLTLEAWRSWHIDLEALKLKNHNFPVQDISKSRVALSIIFIVFAEWTILWMHQGNGVILQSFKDWFGVGEVYCTTSLEEVGATSGPVMQEEVPKGEGYYLRWGFLLDNPTVELGGSAFLEV